MGAQIHLHAQSHRKFVDIREAGLLLGHSDLDVGLLVLTLLIDV